MNEDDTFKALCKPIFEDMERIVKRHDLNHQAEIISILKNTDPMKHYLVFIEWQEKRTRIVEDHGWTWGEFENACMKDRNARG